MACFIATKYRAFIPLTLAWIKSMDLHLSLWLSVSSTNSLTIVVFLFLEKAIECLTMYIKQRSLRKIVNKAAVTKHDEPYNWSKMKEKCWLIQRFKV